MLMLISEHVSCMVCMYVRKYLWMYLGRYSWDRWELLTLRYLHMLRRRTLNIAEHCYQGEIRQHGT